MRGEVNGVYKNLGTFCRRLKIASAMVVRAETRGGKTHVEHTYDQFRTDEVEFPDDCTIDSLKTLEFLRNHKNIIMYGGTGTGRTMLSICIGLIASKHDIPVRFFRTA